ncbi:CPBP family intramembrane glutamic endopeptidase [Eubacterium oxidoreducens]|uniref:CAAX prenyl protease 2/Lysostaphin resistance protein A-like domain-containing protein n=1 Tax=Eubacterium oxidoreducens TaxID=1732 RepID=A0A1G6AGE5_EUBOX|nr:type II CAAX endopeptidase family protein [Eubacterium oxidoreducens]SDB07521.1 hypothetical protein SAMN02910417_00561 [Eubacterium oxidoreducens]
MIKNKVKYFFLSILPFVICLGLEFLISIPFIEIALLRTFSKGQAGFFNALPESLMEYFSNTNFTGGISFAYSIVVIILFGIWYHKLNKKHLLREHTSFSIRSNGVLILLCIVLYYSSNYVTTITAAFFPNALTTYNNLIDQAGLTSNQLSPIMVIYALVLGPIGEELVFRGVTLTYARKALPFWIANILQAALFGLLHMNLIQGVYVFVCGLFFGYIRKSAGTIRASIHLHIMFNVVGLLVSQYLPYYDGSKIIINAVILAGILLLALTLCKWFHHAKRH